MSASAPARRVHDGMRRVAEGIAAAHEVEVDVRGRAAATRSRSTTATSPTFAARWPTDIVGADHVIRLPNPVMGAEDFSYVLAAGARAR